MLDDKSHSERLQEKREEKKHKEQEQTPIEKREVVMHGAALKCPLAQGFGTLVVTSNDILLQDQKWATVNDDSNMVNLQFKGTCGHSKWPAQKIPPPPCMSVINLSPWQKLGTTLVQEQEVLVKESFINCEPAFNTAVAKPIPKVESIAIKDNPGVLDVYFAKFNINSKTEKKGTTTTTVKTLELTKVQERGLSYNIALVIDTSGLEGKKLKVNIKSGDKKVLSEVDTSVKFIDLKDIDAVKDPANYKNVVAKDTFEIEVGKFASDATLSNKDDFKNKAILKLMLNQKPGNLSFDMAKLILDDSNGEALLYVEVNCTEPDVEYNGVAGSSGSKNLFLKGEGKYFKIKHKEQPWIKTAREEMEKGVTEASHCNTIINDYHQVNREHKPSGCATITNAWCASFIGWCLKENEFSAQLDPGAYSYGYTNTRYRNKKVKKDGKTVTLPDHFDDPVWSQKTNNNQLALGAICVVNNRKHVTFAVAKNKEGTHLFGLGGNQGDAVKISPYNTINSSVYPIEYTIKDEDYELPIYYRELKAESVT
ncbi:PAAR-like protein [Flavobacterium ardleyense]|uniref:PAAR-like protein n=1 Tax=Flavobacterium ardleyense TaxID=2038737 RepID=A0ABW5Z4Y4_9FLAO